MTPTPTPTRRWRPPTKPTARVVLRRRTGDTEGTLGQDMSPALWLVAAPRARRRSYPETRDESPAGATSPSRGFSRHERRLIGRGSETSDDNLVRPRQLRVTGGGARSVPRDGDRRARNAVVEGHRWLAVAIAREYHTGGEPLDDLVQVACMALVKAAERFDPAFGVEFKTFAAVTARGELRRYYRDSTWSMRVPRRLQELRYEVRAATEVLRERLRRSPDTGELAAYLHVHPDEIIDCLCADSNFRSLSLEQADGGDNLLGDNIRRDR